MEALRPTPMPPVLQKVQALGELHTARYTYQNVFEHATARQAAEWARYIPGATSLVRNTTRNSALVEVHGKVEAGVDLSKAKMVTTPGKPAILVLPHAKAYRPDVDAKMFNVRPGVFWRDDNLGLNALADARARLSQAALQQGILREAERNAVTQIQKLVDTAVVVNFE